LVGQAIGLEPLRGFEGCILQFVERGPLPWRWLDRRLMRSIGGSVTPGAVSSQNFVRSRRSFPAASGSSVGAMACLADTTTISLGALLEPSQAHQSVNLDCA
jgi:hypothetical protein